MPSIGFQPLVSRLIFTFVLVFLCISTTKASEGQGRRVALVIGNGNYQQATLPKLPNPANDAEDMAKALRNFGFEVIAREDQTLEAMNQAIAEFGSKIGGSEAALFYYAGHGIQVKNQNYLIPVNATIESEASVPYQGININQILDEMDNGKSKINIVMLDACRNNPISGKFRSGRVVGLASPGVTPKGTVIVYATDPGNVAADGDGRNGLFTEGLLTAFKGKDLSLDGVLTVASAEVERISGQTQTPYVNGPKTLQKSFYFGATLDPASQETEKVVWTRIEKSTDIADVEAFIQRYPKGTYAALAGSRLKQLQADPSATVATSSSGGFSALLNEFEACMRQPVDHRTCLGLIKVFIRKNPNDELAAARLVRRNFNSAVALPFFDVLVSRNGESLCPDSDLSLAVIAGLGLPSDYAEAVTARKIFADPCYADLEAAVVKDVASENGASFLKDNACAILQKHGKAPASCTPLPETKPSTNRPDALPKIVKSQIKLEQGKAYRGNDGETVTLIPIQDSELYLIHFDGLRGAWNGKTILHKREERGNGAASFWTEYNGSRWNSIVQRDGMETFAPGYKPGRGFTITYSESASKDINETAVLGAYQP